jgi:hypothetical protein
MLLSWAMPAGAFEIGARALYWFPSFSSDMRVDAGGVTGTLLNMKDTLGVGNESIPSFEVFAGAGKHTVSLAYMPVSYTGTRTLTTPIVFNGKIFAGSVNTDLKLRMVDLEYRYKFLDLENVLAGFSLAAIGQVKYVEGEAKMNSTVPPQSTENTLRAPIPMVGLGAHAGILAGILEARAKIAGIAYSSNYLYEALADLSWTPFPFIDIHGGYKVIRLKIDHNDNFLDAQFAGPYVGLTVSY